MQKKAEKPPKLYTRFISFVECKLAQSLQTAAADTAAHATAATQSLKHIASNTEEAQSTEMTHFVLHAILIRYKRRNYVNLSSLTHNKQIGNNSIFNIKCLAAMLPLPIPKPIADLISNACFEKWNYSCNLNSRPIIIIIAFFLNFFPGWLRRLF